MVDLKGKGNAVYYAEVATRLDEFQVLCANCNHLKRLDEKEDFCRVFRATQGVRRVHG